MTSSLDHLGIAALLRRRLAVTALALAAVALVCLGSRLPVASAARSSPALDVQPFPGTPDASSQTDIAFPALTRRQIKAVYVVGSRSGAHGGRLVALPTGHGTAFLPRRPFTPGEHVSVQARLRSRAAGTACGAPGATSVSFSFTVEVPAPGASVPRGAPAVVAAAARTGVGGQLRSTFDSNGFTHTFYSAPWLHPPLVSMSGTDPDPGLGDVFGDTENSVQAGPLILGPQGQLIYFQPLRQSAAFDVQVQTYQGQSVLTYAQGYISQYGVGVAHDVILDHHYQRVALVAAGNSYNADLHDFEITPQGDALITAYAPVEANLSSIGGPRHGVLIDSIIQEIDIATGQVLWEWHASGHVWPGASHLPVPHRGPYEFFHINSVQQLPNGNLLVSSRYTWSLYEIDMRTGRITLVIGGKHSWLKMGPGTHFEWQHDATMQPDGTITVFDNASNGPITDEPESRALRLRLDLLHRRVELVSAYTSHPPQLAPSQGSVQPLSDENTFVGWGAAPYMTEYGPNGRQLFSLRLAGTVRSYRAERFPWWGQPTTPPSLAVFPTPSGTRVYASWDGATTVVNWQVLTGPSPSSLAPVGQVPDISFETKMWVPSTAAYFAVQALDAGGNVLGTSAAVSR